MLTRYVAWTKKIPSILGVIIILLAGFSACSQTTTNIQNSPPIKIGLSVSVSGDFNADGPAIEQGYQLWANTVNNNGGLLGRPIQLVILKDDSTPEKVAANYKTLITVDHVDLVVGPFSTLLTKSAMVVAHQYGYALPEGSGGGPSVFTEGLNNVFDVSLPVENNLVSFALYILSLPQDQRPRTAAYATEDDPFTQPQVDLVKTMFTDAGIKPVYYHVYPADTTKNYTPFANAVIQSNADVAVLGTLLPDVTAFINTFKQQHYNPKAVIATAGPDAGSDFVKAVGLKSTEGVFVPNGWYAQADNFENAQMVQDYLAQYGGTADSINADVAEAYSVGQVLTQAVTKIQSLNNAKLIAELHSDVFNTVQGTVKFDSTGKNTLALPYLFQWRQGSLIPVYPPFVAAANPQFPKQQWA